MMQPTPDDFEIQTVLEAADAAVDNAQRVRAKHRGHRRQTRLPELADALDRLVATAKPVRRLSGMALPHDFAPETAAALRRASAAINGERRKLRKMLR